MSGSQTTHWPAVAAAIAAGIVAAGYIGKMPAALPVFQRELDLSLLAVSWLVSMFNVIGLAAALLFGLMADRAGAFRFGLAGLALLALGGAWGSAADSAAAMLGSRLLEGAGFVAVAVAGPALIVAASAPQKRSLALGVWGAYLPAGVSLALALSPFALAAFGWRTLWLAIVGVTLVSAVWLAQSARHYRGVASVPARSAADVRRALAQPAPWLYCGAFAVYTLSFHGVMVWLPTYVQQTQAAGIATGALLAAAVMVANVIGNVYGSRLAHRGVARGPMMTAAFLLGGLVSIGIFGPGMVAEVRYGAALVFNLIIGVIPAAVMSGVPRYAASPSEVGTLQGLVVQFANLGIFAGPPLVAAAVTWAGAWEAALAVLLGTAAIGAALSVLLARREASRA